MSHVKLTIDQGIGTIEFFTEQSNALPASVLTQLTKTIMEAGRHADVKVIVLRSGGDRAFCAGASFDELVAIENEASGKAFFMGFANVINAMRKAPKLIIGRVQGKAVGGGIGLAASTDYCFATRFASIKLSELSIGIGPFVVGPVIKRKMGLSTFTRMGIDASKFHEAGWAQTKGLYMQVFENIASMDNAVNRLAQKLATYHTDAMTQLKRVFWEGTDHWDTLLAERAQTSGQLVVSDFTKSFLRDVKNK